MKRCPVSNSINGCMPTCPDIVPYTLILIMCFFLQKLGVVDLFYHAALLPSFKKDFGVFLCYACFVSIFSFSALQINPQFFRIKENRIWTAYSGLKWISLLAPFEHQYTFIKPKCVIQRCFVLKKMLHQNCFKGIHLAHISHVLYHIFIIYRVG